MAGLTNAAAEVETKARHLAAQALQLRKVLDSEDPGGAPAATHAATVTARYRNARAELLAAVQILDDRTQEHGANGARA